MSAGATRTPEQARREFRDGLVTATAGWAPGFAQANLVSVPVDHAYDVLLFCQRNPKPCPLLDVTEAGSWIPASAPEADLRTDLPRYRVWRDGQLVDEPTDIRHAWRDDLVSFLIGCSFTFEAALLEAGVPVRHLEQNRNVPMYRTDQPCRPAGRLRGNLVVSMRPVPAPLVATAVQVSASVPAVHGAPVQVGDPVGLGIADLASPDFGAAVEVRDGEVPMFWACGVTPQVAIMVSRPPFAITHAPGHMFVTDIPDLDLRGGGWWT